MGNLNHDPVAVAKLYEQCANMQPDVLLAWQGMLSWSDKHGLDATVALLNLNRLQPENVEVSKRLATLETRDPKLLRRLLPFIADGKVKLLQVLLEEEGSRVQEEVEKRRNRLGAPPLAQLRVEVEQEIIGTGTEEIESLMEDPSSLIQRLRVKLEWQVRMQKPTCADRLIPLCKQHPDLSPSRTILAEISDAISDGSSLEAGSLPSQMQKAQSLFLAESYSDVLRIVPVCEDLISAAQQRWNVKYPRLKGYLLSWKVKSLVSLGRYREAIPLLDVSDSLLVECYEQTGEYDKALDLVSDDPLRRAWLLTKMGHWQEAKESYRLCSDDLAPLSLMRLKWMEERQIDREHVLALIPRLEGRSYLLSIAFEYLGHSYHEAGDWERAGRCYRKALSLDAGNAAAAIGLVRCAYSLEEDCSIYVELLQSVCQEHPRLASGWHLLACLQPAQAIAHLQSALKANGDWLSDSFDPERSRSWPHWPLPLVGERLLLHLLADAYRKDGRLVAARRVYLRLLQEPESAGCTEKAARMGLARVEAELGAFEDALSREPCETLSLDIRLRWLKQRLREKGKSEELNCLLSDLTTDAQAAEEWWVLAECSTLYKSPSQISVSLDESISGAIEELLRDKPELLNKALGWLACLQQKPTVSAWANLAICLTANECDEEVHQWAWECAQQACCLNSKDWRGWEAAGLVAMSRAKGNVQWASLSQHCFCQALAIQAVSPRVWIHLAALYGRLGDAELAQECLDKAVMMDPDMAAHWMAKAALDPARALTWLQQAMEAPDAGIVPDAVVERWAWLTIKQHLEEPSDDLNRVLSLFRLHEKLERYSFPGLQEMVADVLGLQDTNPDKTLDLESLLEMIETTPGWPHLWHSLISWRTEHPESASQILQWLEERLPGWGRLRPIGAEQTGMILERLVGQRIVAEEVQLSAAVDLSDVESDSEDD